MQRIAFEAQEVVISVGWSMLEHILGNLVLLTSFGPTPTALRRCRPPLPSHLMFILGALSSFQLFLTWIPSRYVAIAGIS